MSTIILGPKLIGKEASEKAQRTAVDETGGGAIQLGSGLATKKLFGKAREAARQGRTVSELAVPFGTVAAAAAVPSVPTALPVTPEPDANKVVAKGRGAPTPAPVVSAGLSEDAVEIMLAEDPNAWDIVAEAEAQRPEGWRPRVAKMLLNAAPDAKEKPMPSDVSAHLVRIAQVGVKAEGDKLRAAVDAAGEVGTGRVLE